MSQTQQVRGRATTIQTRADGKTYVTYHATDVVAFDHTEIILNTGGYETATTKTRMNQASNQFGLDYRVYQEDFTWFVSFKGEDIPFDGNTVTLKR